MRRINRAGLDIIRDSESLRLKAYYCPAGILTIGWGSTGPHVKPGMVITKEQADDLLAQDLQRFESCVASACGQATDNQFSAMVSLAYNIGPQNFLGSSVLRQHLNGNPILAANAFKLWNKAKGRVLAGLVTRRAKEAELYRTP